MILPVGSIEGEAEARRRIDGPICALCAHSPLTDADLEPLAPGDPPRLSRAIRTFRCEPRGRSCEADGGRGCSFFERRDF